MKEPKKTYQERATSFWRSVEGAATSAMWKVLLDHAETREYRLAPFKMCIADMATKEEANKMIDCYWREATVQLLDQLREDEVSLVGAWDKFPFKEARWVFGEDDPTRVEAIIVSVRVCPKMKLYTSDQLLEQILSARPK